MEKMTMTYHSIVLKDTYIAIYMHTHKSKYGQQERQRGKEMVRLKKDRQAKKYIYAENSCQEEKHVTSWQQKAPSTCSEPTPPSPAEARRKSGP